MDQTIAEGWGANLIGGRAPGKGGGCIERWEEELVLNIQRRPFSHTIVKRASANAPSQHSDGRPAAATRHSTRLLRRSTRLLLGTRDSTRGGRHRSNHGAKHACTTWIFGPQGPLSTYLLNLTHPVDRRNHISAYLPTCPPCSLPTYPPT